MLYINKGKYINKIEFNKIKYFFLSCFLLIKRLSINITMLTFKTILKKYPAINWIWLYPKNGFKNFPISNSM